MQMQHTLNARTLGNYIENLYKIDLQGSLVEQDTKNKESFDNFISGYEDKDKFILIVWNPNCDKKIVSIDMPYDQYKIS